MGKKAKRRAVLRIEVPFTSDPPVLTSAELGLPRLLRRPAASFAMDVTVVDAADGRLLRDGVVVAHRVVGGIGEWYLSAARWAPHLPVECTRPLGSSGDLPEEMARRLRPLIRGAVLGPIAALRCHRDEWALRDAAGETVAVVRDERVTVRHGGVATARYREITVTPEKRGVTKAQREFLIAAGLAVNGTVVDTFPTLQERLGAPATGLTNFPVPQQVTPDASLEDFVSTVFAGHLLAIATAELERRRVESDDVAATNALLWAFGKDLRGLAPVLEPGWREATERLLRDLPWASQAELEPALPEVLNALVGGARAPRLGDLSRRPAAILIDRAQHAGQILAERCRALTEQAPDEQWAAARLAAEQLSVAATVAVPLSPRVLGAMVRRLDGIVAALHGCEFGASATIPELAGLSPEQAYQQGVDAERRRSRVAVRRADFIERWPRVVRRARRQLKKARKK
ncbi:MAG: hypothetical protein IPJ61_16245 [Tessaracoccus sp.]|uniref:hypothetical protein n=1 Tax=Tessaracoccus sp. TaxID=1971211 RepID=UPI001EC1EB1F|nr:hypothetical protein [Tessaracoccus sp.]MBK7822561.1 hypothetical protein [Tessaracoccus sp.]